MVPTHRIHIILVSEVVNDTTFPAVSSASSTDKRSSYEPGRASVGERRLSTTPTAASTSFWAFLSFLPYSRERGLIGLPRSSYSWI
jgi:hypothetical protein